MNKSHDSGWASDAPTPAQLKEFFAQIASGRITRKGLQVFLRGKTDEVGEEQKKTWQIFYKKFFNLDFVIPSIRIPERKPGFDRLIIVAEGLTINQVYDVCVKHFPCSRYTDDLDKATTKNDRDSSQGSYAIWVRDRVEADEELNNLSAYQLEEQEISGINLLERLLYELKYFSETGRHLDIESWTLCSGSHDSGGDVLEAGWYDGKFRVLWGYPDRCAGSLRARAAVS